MFIEKGRFFDLNNEFLVPTVQIQIKRSIGFNIQVYVLKMGVFHLV